MQALKPKSAQAQETINSLRTSTAAVKNSIRIMASAIAFQRGLFPLDAFKDRNYCGIDLKMLNPDKNGEAHAGPRLFMDYLEKGIFDAFEKGFVDRVMLNVHDSDPARNTSNIVESYAFRVEYDKGRIVAEEHASAIARHMKKTLPVDAGAAQTKRISRDQVVGQTRSMIKTLTSTMAGLPGLPDAKWITFYLSYHDHTPDDYEPPLFESASTAKMPVFKAPAQTFRQGVAATGYHNLGLKVRTCDQDEGAADHDSDLESDGSCGTHDGGDHAAAAAVTTPERLAAGIAKATLSDPRPQSDSDDEKPSITMADWDQTKERMYRTLARALRRAPARDPRDVIRDSEWGYSISERLLGDFLRRFAAEEGSEVARAAAAEGMPAPKSPLEERAVSSQNSFEDAQENVRKISRSKRPLRCDRAGGSVGGRKRARR